MNVINCRRLLPLLLPLLLLGCAGIEKRGDAVKSDDHIAVASGVELRLLPAADVLKNVVIMQRIDASYQPTKALITQNQSPPPSTDQRSFIVQIEAGADVLQMVGLTPMAVQMFALSQQGTQLDVDVPPYVSLPFDPRYMLADMQLSLADITKLNAQLAGAQLRAAADGSWRELVTADGKILVRIDYRGAFCSEGSEVRLAHGERHYEIRITTLSCERS